jgi:hypothetical protein
MVLEIYIRNAVCIYVEFLTTWDVWIASYDSISGAVAAFYM